MALDPESRAAEIRGFATGALPKLPKPPPKPLDVHVARAAANNLIVNVVNLNFEVRKIVIAQGIQFNNFFRIKKERTGSVIPKSLQDDFPDIVLQGDTRAVFISDVQRVEYQIEVVTTKDAFKNALQTPGVHVIYTGHSRLGRGPCFGPDLNGVIDATGDFVADVTGDNWGDGETGQQDKFGLFRMGRPFMGAGFQELDEHKFKFRPVPTIVKVPPSDVDPLSQLIGTTALPDRLKPLSLDPVVASYHSSQNEHTHGGVLEFAGFSDLEATDLKCRCFTVLSCDSFRHFREVLRIRKGFKKSENEGLAYFVQGVYFDMIDRMFLGSMLEYNVRNDFQSWEPSLDFAVKRTNAKLVAARTGFNINMI